MVVTSAPRGSERRSHIRMLDTKQRSHIRMLDTKIVRQEAFKKAAHASR